VKVKQIKFTLISKWVEIEIKEHAITNSIKKVFEKLNVSHEKVVNVITSLGKDELHKIVRSGYMKKTKHIKPLIVINLTFNYNLIPNAQSIIKTYNNKSEVPFMEHMQLINLFLAREKYDYLVSEYGDKRYKYELCKIEKKIEEIINKLKGDSFKIEVFGLEFDDRA
jgi:hypothetical protein